MSAGRTKRTVVPILLFHRVVMGADAEDPFAVTLASFRRSIELVARSGRRALTVGDYARARRAGESLDDVVVVTFDDGAQDFAELALPVLEAHGVPATMYVVAGLVGRTAEWLGTGVPLMGWSDLAAVERSSVTVELGAHSMEHPQLDLIGSVRAADEIRRSKAVLEDGLGHEVTTFAYPFGHHDRSVRAAVVDAGYMSGCAVKNRLSPLDDDLFALARVTLVHDDPADRVSELLAGRGAPIAGRRELLRTMAYRQYRRQRLARSNRTVLR